MEDLRSAIRNFERNHVHRVLKRYDRDKPAAAKTLGVGISSLYRKTEKLGLNGKNVKRK